MEPEMISSIIPLPWFCVSLECIHKYVSWVQVLARWPFKSSDLTLSVRKAAWAFLQFLWYTVYLKVHVVVYSLSVLDVNRYVF